MLAEAGHASLAAELDPDQVRQAMPAILATIRTTMAYRAVRVGPDEWLTVGCASGSSDWATITSRAGSRPSKGFPTSSRSSRCMTQTRSSGRTLAPPHHDPSLRAGLGEQYRALPFETRLADLIERHGIDIALVTLPNIDAPNAIEQLAHAGVHLVVDKPAARSAPEARRAFDAVRASGVRAVTGLTRRYSPAARRARELVAAGRLGRLVSGEAVFATSSVAVRDPQNLLFDPIRSGGGILSWLGIHDLDSLLWLTGEPVVEVSAMSGRVGDPGLGG